MKNERLKWACRRGMLELDVLLEPFYDKCFEDLSPQQKKTFETLLSHQDAELFNWFIGFSEPNENEMKATIKMIKTAKSNEYQT